MKKIIFFDIDGTLLNLDKEVPESTLLAINKLRENGHVVAIATGRSPYMFSELREKLKVDTYVSLNGQVVVYNNEIIEKHPIDKKQLENLELFAMERNHPMVYLDEKQMIASIKEKDFRIETAVGSLKFPYPKFLDKFSVNNDVFQALVFAESKDEESYHQQFPYFEFLRWHDYSIDVIPEGASKARGIKSLIEKVGFEIKDVVAFGDGLNDVEMLKVAGVGVCMGNGVHKAKEAADYVTTHVNEDGIYNALKHLELIK